MFKQRKHKRFNYTPRYQKDNTSTEAEVEGFEAKWKNARNASKKRGSILTTLPALLIMLIAILVLMYILKGYE